MYCSMIPRQDAIPMHAKFLSLLRACLPLSKPVVWTDVRGAGESRDGGALVAWTSTAWLPCLWFNLSICLSYPHINVVIQLSCSIQHPSISLSSLSFFHFHSLLSFSSSLEITPCLPTFSLPPFLLLVLSPSLPLSRPFLCSPNISHSISPSPLVLSCSSRGFTVQSTTGKHALWTKRHSPCLIVHVIS